MNAETATADALARPGPSQARSRSIWQLLLYADIVAVVVAGWAWRTARALIGQATLGVWRRRRLRAIERDWRGCVGWGWEDDGC